MKCVFGEFVFSCSKSRYARITACNAFRRYSRSTSLKVSRNVLEYISIMKTVRVVHIFPYIPENCSLKIYQKSKQFLSVKDGGFGGL